MSMHKIPLTPLEEEGLRLHGLPIGTPSQRSDTFRQGVAWAIGEARRLNKENERLKADAEKHKSIPVRFVSHQHIRLKVTDANPNPVAIRIISECDGAWFDMPQEKIDVMRIEMQSAIDAARGAK